MATDATEPLIESPAAMRHAFVVLGMHRTGTSAMTRMLSLLGASLPKQLMGANESNPSGHWEPQTVADLNDEILQALDSEWDDVFAFRPKHYLSNFDRFYLGRAVELLAEGFDGSDVIVLKDPRISVLATFWDRVLGEAGFRAHYVIMVRNPIEVAEFLRARDQFPLEKSLLLWSSYMVALERDTRGRPRTFVSYDQLMSDWRAARRRIEQDSGVPFARDTAAAANEIDRFLERGLRHHRARSDELSTRPEIPEHVKTLYGIFAAACEGAEIDVEAIAKIEAELGGVERLVGPISPTSDRRERVRPQKTSDWTRRRRTRAGRSSALRRSWSKPTLCAATLNDCASSRRNCAPSLLRMSSGSKPRPGSGAKRNWRWRPGKSFASASRRAVQRWPARRSRSLPNAMIFDFKSGWSSASWSLSVPRFSRSRDRLKRQEAKSRP